MSWDACHDKWDYEDIEPEGPTLAGTIGNHVVETLAEVFAEYGLPHTLEPGWTTRNPSYNWYKDAPHGVMVHHTATTGYAPKRAYPTPDGDRTDGKTIANLLIQPDGTVNFISSDPANYSSGLNWKGILDDHVLPRERFYGPQSGPLGPEWYGNRAFVNIETVHPGDGSAMPDVQERMVIITSAVLVAIIGTDATGIIGHYDGRGTKVDPRWNGDNYRIAYIQDAAQALLDANEIPQPPGGTVTHFKIDNDYPEYEQIAWMLHIIRGGDIDPDEPALPQLTATMPWKTSPVHVDADDYRYLCDLFGLTERHCEELFTVGLNRNGKEIAQLRRLAYGS